MNTPLQDNTRTVAAALAQLGIPHATVSYSGSGDSGDSFIVMYADPDKGLLCESHEVSIQALRYDSTARASVLQTMCMSVDAALQECADQAITAAGHDGYENNEGGRGSFTVCASGYAVLEHIDHGETTGSVEPYEFEPPAADGGEAAEGADPAPCSEAGIWRAVKPLADALAAAGAAVVALDYEGSGDSGDVENITCFAADNTEVDLSGVLVDGYAYESHYDADANDFILQGRSKQALFEASMENLFDFIVEKVMGQRGWEINEGASGNLRLTATGRLTVEHTTYSEGGDLCDVESWNDDLRAEHEQATGYGDA